MKTENKFKTKVIPYEAEIRKAFQENLNRFGRNRLSQYLLLKFNFLINPRTLGRYMRKINLICFVRKAKRKRETKNTNSKFEELPQRDYNGIHNDIYANRCIIYSHSQRCEW
ncbi:hypothetical protein [Metamycoplasma equirhinis]|uniref:hypothetical protein n=1 Tax=Metamycoplasma equirhinis TaxID=92402 RepID=UPI002573EB1F|nr:hypothetical protein [Metamycoplasma equirhinis]BDX52817.1 hypothetical protein JPM7_4240 [Metamycoplasma equirhinis]